MEQRTEHVISGRPGQGTPKRDRLQSGTFWDKLPISIPDPAQAVIHLAGLVVALLLMGVYIVEEKPGLDGAGWRALMTPNHPSNPITHLTELAADAPRDPELAEARRIGVQFRSQTLEPGGPALDAMDSQTLELQAIAPLTGRRAAPILSASATTSSSW